ncbi:MAG: hypothetical protein SWY16_07520 [Cyanobacteriota bacterium]|nr:hypothetical protein [Cyanobacteriota bacterium]
MKRFTRYFAISVAIAFTFATAQTAVGETLELSPGFTEPTTLDGIAGGTSESSNCGYIADTPNHELVLTEDFDYLRVWVNGTENLTLLVRGPGGEFCAPRDPQQSGYWEEGTYSIFVGDRQGMEENYTLSISTNP